MVRLFGVSKKKTKKRLSPSARTSEGMRAQHPMYQYALNEFAQAVKPGTSNDDGRVLNSNTSPSYDDSLPPAPSSLTASRSIPDNKNGLPSSNLPSTDSSSMQEAAATAEPPLPPTMANDPHQRDRMTEPSIYSSNQPTRLIAVRSPFEAEMPDATYEEYYGEAYTGAPIKYIYPSGYQSMRPRSCPWKLSIVVCMLFTWLSVFIVGHCSDQVDESQYRNDEIDDDTLVIDIRWCGSRPLYLMWVTSMLITGLAAAYCSVIGYIKVRDFAVANSRSQPPGVGDSKSDYYVKIEDGISPAPSEDTMAAYGKSIYQSDGTPQFWGAHIYRPTQAAVAITSR